MSTTLDRPRSVANAVHAFAGTGLLLRFMLRRDRVRFPAWVLGLSALLGYFALAMGLVLDEAALQTFAVFAANPVMALMGGPGYGFDQLTVERFLVGMYGGYLMIGAALMSILTVSRHTRVEEQSGRAELLRAGPIGRHAQLTAALVVALLMNAAMGVLMALVFATSPVQPDSLPATLLFAASIGVAGFVFAGVTAVTAQLSPFSRIGSGLAGAVLATAYLVRGFGDMSTAQHGELGWLSWLSPIGWSQQTAPFTLDRWWPLAIAIGATALLVVIGFALQSRRDLGAGILPDRLGAASGAAWLRSPLALAVRLERGALGWWSVAMLLAGLAFGAFVQPLADGASGMPEQILAVIGGPAGIVDGYIGFIAIYFAVAVAVFVILSVRSLGEEERSARVETVLAAPVSRVGWMLSWLSVTALGALLLMTLAGVGTGVGAMVTTGEPGRFGDALLGHIAQTPALWLLIGITAVLYGFAPRLAGLAWLVFGASTVISFFGLMLELDEALLRMSLFNLIGRYPSEPIDWAAAAVLTAFAIVLAVLGAAGFRRRDLR